MDERGGGGPCWSLPDDLVVAALALSRDGQRGLARLQSQRGPSRLWRLQRGPRGFQRRSDPAPPGVRLHAAALSPDGERIAALDDRGALMLWAFAQGTSGEPLFTLPKQPDPLEPRGLRFSPDGEQLALWYRDGAILLFPGSLPALARAVAAAACPWFAPTAARR